MRFTITPLGSVGGRTVDQVVGDIVRYLNRPRPAVAPAQSGPGTEAPSQYYADGGDEPGRWLGRGAQATGLGGEVDPEHFARVLAGRDPLTGERLITARGSAGRRATLGVGASTRRSEDGEALYDEHDAAAALGVEADVLERLLTAGDEVSAEPYRRRRQPAGSYLVSSVDSEGTRWVTESELTRLEVARASGPSSDEITAGGGGDDLLPLAEAARLAGVTARYLRGLARRWEQHRTEIEQAREEGRPAGRAYIVAWRGTKNRWLVKRSDLAEFVSRRKAPAVRVGFDLTLTTEKSLGVLALLGDDNMRGAVLESIEAGNDLALGWWERHAGARVGGEVVPADGWTAASFRHLTSRALDPFPHHHNVIANAVTTTDGERRALDARILYRHAVGASALATAEMRHRLSTKLGVRWRRSPSGGWEIDGLPPDVLREFSRRRNEIEEALAELEEAIGRTSTIDELRNIVAETRPAKQQADPTDLRANWWKRARSHGFSPRDLEQCTGRASPPEPRRDEIVSLLDRLGAPDGITAEGSIFTRGDVLSALADAPLPNDRGNEQPLLIGAVQLEELADAFLASQRVIRLEPGENRPRLRGLGDEPLYTTTEMLRIQQRIIDAYRNGLHAGSAIATGNAVDAVLRAAGQLSHEQAQLVRRLCTSGHHLQCAVGRAGTGKTTAMGVAASAWAASGYRVVGAAIKGEAARALGAAAGLPTETVAWYLAHPDPRRGPLDSRTVLIVDEASTLGDADLDRLIGIAQRAGATVRLIGDPAQHGAVAAGGMFRVLCEQHPAHTPQLTENRRLQHTGDLAAVEALRGGPHRTSTRRARSRRPSPPRRRRPPSSTPASSPAGGTPARTAPPIPSWNEATTAAASSTGSPAGSSRPTARSRPTRSRPAEGAPSPLATRSSPGAAAASCTQQATEPPTCGTAHAVLSPASSAAMAQTATPSSSTFLISALSEYRGPSSTTTPAATAASTPASITATPSPATPSRAPPSRSQPAASTSAPAGPRSTWTSPVAATPTTSTPPAQRTHSTANGSQRRRPRHSTPRSPSASAPRAPRSPPGNSTPERWPVPKRPCPPDRSHDPDHADEGTDMTKVHYFTARCPQGCEAWLHPLAVEPHLLDSRRCRARPWVDEIPDMALVGAPLAQDFADVLPPDLLGRPSFSGDRILSPDPDNYIPIHLCQGVMVRSPVPGVRAQRWAVVTSAAVREHGASAIEVAMTPAGFAELEEQLTAQGRLTRCPICGDTTTVKGLRTHQARNRACRWRVAAAEVRARWTDGYRDPYSVDGAPLKWGDITATAHWRKRAHVVRFPAWSAVLLAPEVPPDTPTTRGDCS